MSTMSHATPLDAIEALRLAERHLAGENVGGGAVITEVAEFPVGWVFYWDSRRHQESGHFSDALAGNAPVLVDRTDGSVHWTGTARPVEEYVERYVNRDPGNEGSWHP